ncbi:MAG TPA: hypothetical protein VHM92_05970 [Allosphingosinicella sp.]|nr:hypothetical protein [Allosphingosinicella sp.]
MKKALAFLLLLLLAPVPVGPAAAQPSPPPDPAEYRTPPPQFPQVAEFLDAIAIEREAAHIVDSFWQPAIKAFVAANPDKAAEARAFATARRDAEVSPALGRLRALPMGEQLIRMHSRAYFFLMGMTQLAHDPGISLHLLLPPEEVEAAGLKVPPNRSYEELIGLPSEMATP